MLRTPRNPKRHMDNCTCRACSHPDVAFFRAMNRPRHMADRWEAVDLKRAPAAEPCQPTQPRPDLVAVFDAAMANLIARVRGYRPDIEGDQT